MTLLLDSRSIALMMSATVRVPPILREVTCAPLAARLPTIWSSSCSADCGSSSSVAMRISTSARCFSGSSGNILADSLPSSCASRLAMTCGCSSPTSCATARGSIHFSASMPAPPPPPDRMRSTMSSPRCLPNDAAMTFLTKSGLSWPNASPESSFCRNAWTTFSALSLVTDGRAAIARPTASTSRGSMCLRIAAASCSPSDIIRMAARSGPDRSEPRSAIGRHPILHHLRSTLGILRDDAARRCDVTLIVRQRLRTGAGAAAG